MKHIATLFLAVLLTHSAMAQTTPDYPQILSTLPHAYTTTSAISQAGVTVPNPVPNIMWDDDVDTDPDSFAVASMINHWVDTGQVNVLSETVDSFNPYGAPVLSIINTYWGHASIPVGAYQGGSEAGSSFTAAVVAQFRPGDTRANYTSCVNTMRTGLASAANSSVVLIGSGFAHCILGLVQSGADSISPLTGTQLIQQKVTMYVQMGGDYPNSSGVPPSGAEFNFANDAANFATLFSTWTSQNGFPPLYSVGYTAGLNIISGVPQWFPTTNPAHYGFTQSGFANRPSWDALAVWYGLFGNVASAWTFSANGANTVNSSTGANTWSSSTAAGQYYLINNQAAPFYEAYLDGQFYQGAAWFIPYNQTGELIWPALECSLNYGCSFNNAPYTMTISAGGTLQSTPNINGEAGFIMNNTNSGASALASFDLLADAANGQIIETDGAYSGPYGTQINSLELINRNGNIIFKPGGFADANITLNLSPTLMVSNVPESVHGIIRSQVADGLGAQVQATTNTTLNVLLDANDTGATDSFGMPAHTAGVTSSIGNELFLHSSNGTIATDATIVPWVVGSGSKLAFAGCAASGGLATGSNQGIASCTNSSTGNYTVTFNSSYFTSVPRCALSAVAASGTPSANIVTISNTGFTAATWALTSSPAATNEAFDFTCMSVN